MNDELLALADGSPPMTSIKEALERCRNYIASPLRMSNDDDEKKRRDDIVMCADQALASLERVGLATRAARYDALANAALAACRKETSND